MNGGICSNGVCSCSVDFEGSNCQYSKSEDGGPGLLSALFSNLMILLVYGILIAVIVGLFGLAYYYVREAKKKAAQNKYQES
jgi:hypothetical protein